MTFRPKLTWLLHLILILLWVQPSLSQSKDTRTTTVIRVGVITYSDYDKTYTENQQRLTHLADLYNQQSAGKTTKISFELAVGSYDDVLAWYKDGLIDAAILSAGPVAELLSADGRDGKIKIEDLYVGTVTADRAAADNILAVPERRVAKNQIRYQSVCLVSKNSEIKDWPQLRQSIKDHNVEFLFVHLLSASGRILPEYLLRKLGVSPTELHENLLEVKWTYDHDATIRALEQSANNGKTRVAFVWDSVGDSAEVRDKVRKIPVPGLDELWIPQEVVLMSSSVKAQEQLAKVVKDVFVSREEGRQTGCVEVPDWTKAYKEGIVQWVKALKLKPSEMRQQPFGLQQIIDKVRSYENSHPGGSRLALVLSGGGAKCAYQIGVIKAIENLISSSNKQEALNKNASHNKQVIAHHASDEGPKARPLDIGLVVGTSGGAINALSVALGLTRTEEGQDALSEVWLSFKQQDFFRPWSPLPVILGLLVGLGQALIIILALRLIDDNEIEWKKFTRLSVTCLAVITISLLFTSWRFWASIPLIAIVILVEARLNDQPTENWRSRTGLTLVMVGLVELIVGKAQLTPWNYMPYIFSVLVFILLALITVLAIRVVTLDAPNWRRFALTIVSVIAGIGIAVLLLWQAPVTWMSQLSKHHMLHHFWMAVSMNLMFSAICLMVIGSLMLVAERSARAKEKGKDQSLSKSRLSRLRGFASALSERNTQVFATRKSILTGFAYALLVLFALQLGRSLFFDTSLSRSDGIDHVFAEKLPILLQHHPDLRTEITPQGKDDHARLSDISQRILQGRLLKRDLVITSSLLTDGEDEPDRYFYYQYQGQGSYQRLPPDKTFPSDKRFSSFQETDLSPKMLDVVIGSATIYPVFKPRHLTMSQPPDFDLIDGGFAHNSPIEAAVAWGATHIILIEASPKPKPSQHLNLLDNSVDAFNYLFNEAQVLDARSRGKIEIFSIRPDGDDSASDPNLCTFDFDDSLMRGVIEKGFFDALNVENPKFLRQRGQPIF